MKNPKNLKKTVFQLPNQSAKIKRLFLDFGLSISN
jgi:hypothetical protein